MMGGTQMFYVYNESNVCTRFMFCILHYIRGHSLISMEARVSFGEEILVLDFKRRKEKDMP